MLQPFRFVSALLNTVSVKRAVLIPIAILLCLEFAGATIRRVPQNFPTIQSGINAAVNGDTILVSEGTFFENIKYRGKKIIVGSQFVLDRDTLHIARTIINGSQLTHPDSGSVVCFINGEDTTSVLCGFTIRGGKGTLITAGRTGGGVFLYRSGGKVLNCHIVGNVVQGPYLIFGGGLGSFSDTDQNLLVVRDCLIDSNRIRATVDFALGGGMHLGSMAIVENNRIISNESHYQGTDLKGASGGGIYVGYPISNFHVDISNNKIIGNTSVSEGGYGAYSAGLDFFDVSFTLTNNIISDNILNSAAGGLGAGLRVVYGSGSNIISGNTFSNNRSVGTPTVDGGGILLLLSNNVNIQKNHFEGNESTWGGGIEDVQSVDTRVEGNSFMENIAAETGGAMYIESAAIVTNNVMIGNHAAFGGGVFVGAFAALSGAKDNNLIKLKGSMPDAPRIAFPGEKNKRNSHNRVNFPLVSTPVLMNNTIVSNIATSLGGGIHVDNGSQPVIINSIVWGNAGGQISVGTGSAEVHYSDIQDGWQGGNGNISSNPRFADLLFHLASNSPCISTATDSMQIGGTWYRAPVNDFFGNPRPRPVGTRPDIGAHEFQTTTGVENMSDVPVTFALSQNYPNPFNPSTQIRFSVGENGRATLEVFNILGQKVATLFDDVAEAGQYYKMKFNAVNLASGLYLYKLQSGAKSEMRKLMVLK